MLRTVTTSAGRRPVDGVNRRARIRMTPAEIDAFLAEPHTMAVGTLNPDGTIHMAAMWYGFLDGLVAIQTKAKSQKARNLSRNDTITCMVEAGTSTDELRGVQIVGRAEIFDDRDRLIELARSMHERQSGVAPPDGPLPDVERAMNKRIGIVVHPQRVASWDHRKL
jgi:PPOX class probable F420-dependent enzyme